MGDLRAGCCIQSSIEPGTLKSTMCAVELDDPGCILYSVTQNIPWGGSTEKTLSYFLLTRLAAILREMIAKEAYLQVRPTGRRKEQSVVN